MVVVVAPCAPLPRCHHGVTRDTQGTGRIRDGTTLGILVAASFLPIVGRILQRTKSEYGRGKLGARERLSLPCGRAELAFCLASTRRRCKRCATRCDRAPERTSSSDPSEAGWSSWASSSNDSSPWMPIAASILAMTRPRADLGAPSLDCARRRERGVIVTSSAPKLRCAFANAHGRGRQQGLAVSAAPAPAALPASSDAPAPKPWSVPLSGPWPLAEAPRRFP